MKTYPGGDATFRIPHEEPIAAECASLTCELSAAATEPGFVTGVVVFGLVALVAFAYIRDAKACCREERRRVIDERDAFEEFSNRVASLDSTPVDAASTSLDGPVIGIQRGSGLHAPGDVRLRRVLDAYEDTVLSLPHYTEEYDETATESLAAELGPDTTATLSTGGTLSPELQSALVTRSRHAAGSRADLADAIGAEIDALTDAETTLTRIDRERRTLHEHLDGVPPYARFDAQVDVWERLAVLEDRLDDAAVERQRRLRDPPMAVDFVTDDGGDAPTFYRYLYGSLEGTSYPVLAAFSSLAERIREDRDRLVGRIAYGTR
ncbi:hypothetical protein GRS48_04110 [Halorubrum sp. JWXQ-INN 858]|uniref:DUF7260 family protein n=1 Tax=Halorubrum sp. JWXQ-INN 858 TaxID=2690782 RepID=UPI00135A19B4|nr:hypothetical protein [Halorubrum sp. JWXQ-INN 858]MWV64009.1 hypothetical protein [Halorubrum sp. JWXQ-INN 858]